MNRQTHNLTTTVHCRGRDTGIQTGQRVVTTDQNRSGRYCPEENPTYPGLNKVTKDEGDAQFPVVITSGNRG
ncbi:hypothetical protein RRG08_013712 [Elysia crispata]|uniref:Uncharacterized protein n=1 Tax=Elysia crispata TaxID=231223 RepID=A0AAE0Z8C1_9GAST|nr:hypothetical protein RRG08_013712 [Elysia crispata]